MPNESQLIFNQSKSFIFETLIESAEGKAFSKSENWVISQTSNYFQKKEDSQSR